MRRNENMITGSHLHGVPILEQQLGFAFQHDYPFVFLLIVPTTFWTGMSRGDDPLNANVFVLGKDPDQFLWERVRKVGEEVVHEDVDWGLATTSAIRLAYQRFGVPAVSALWERRSLHVLISRMRVQWQKVRSRS
jgi:hypothetical protein